MIPLVSGNLSVEWFMKRLLGPQRDDTSRAAVDAEIEQMAALGVAAVEDYVAWAAIEPKEGAWDWSFHRRNAELVKGRRLQYVVYPWLHVVPDWQLARPDFVGFRCLEHDGDCSWPSIFAPSTLEAYRRFYAELKRALGDVIDAICVGFPADYGEVGYPTGMGAWVSRLVPPRDHVHPGFWAGDDHAREAFRSAAASASAASAALVLTSDRPRRPEELVRNDASDAREFADFYLGAMTGFVDRVLVIVRELFPHVPLWIKIGHGAELLAYGIDATALVRTAARHGAAIRTTQATLPTLHQKRLATPCRHWAVPLASEPPVDVGRDTVLARLFHDAASGVVEYFDYPEHLVGARDLISAQGALLDGAQNECDVGLFFASAFLRRHVEHGMPPALLDLAETLRDRFDFEVVDEALIDAGALASLSVFGLLEAAELSEPAAAELVRFVACGGTLVVGPDVDAARLPAALGSLLAKAPAADDCVDLGAVGADGNDPSRPNDALTSMLVPLGGAGESLRLSGDWHPREDASQFRGTPPAGETARWTGHRASLHFPVRRGTRYLLEIECWVHPRSLHLDHAVFADVVRLGTIRRAGLQRFAAWIPAEVVSREVLEIALESAVFRPADHGVGPDRRELGVAVLWMRLTQEHAPATALGEGGAPPLTGRVRDDDLTERGSLRHGDGAIVVSCKRPLATLLALLDHAVRRRSRWGKGAPCEAGSGEPLPGLRMTRFADKLVLWNRTKFEQVVALGGIDSTHPPIVMPAGALVGVDLRSGRTLS